ncbi:MAG: hypothetical protein HC844_00015 [Tabrizicola sp.]|nr:hypothetical protein [Tabrizicola sp.]
MAQPEMTDPQKGAEPDYKVERPKPKMTRQQRLGMGALLAGASLAALWTVWPSSRAIPDVETSAVEEFQDQGGGSPFGAIEPGPDAKPASDGFSDIEGELASQREDLEARNATLQSEVERLQRELGVLADRADAEKDQTAKELALALEEAQSQTLALMEDMRRQFDQEIAVLKASADTAGAAEAQREAELPPNVPSARLSLRPAWRHLRSSSTMVKRVGQRMPEWGCLRPQPRVEMRRDGISCSRGAKPPPRK